MLPAFKLAHVQAKNFREQRRHARLLDVILARDVVLWEEQPETDRGSPLWERRKLGVEARDPELELLESGVVRRAVF